MNPPQKKNYRSLKNLQLKREMMQDIGSGLNKKDRIELGLKLLECQDSVFARRHNQIFNDKDSSGMTRQTLAFVCGCTDSAILAIERKALKKLRAGLYERGVAPEMLAVLRESSDMCGRQIAMPINTRHTLN